MTFSEFNKISVVNEFDNFLTVIVYFFDHSMLFQPTQNLQRQTDFYTICFLFMLLML